MKLSLLVLSVLLAAAVAEVDYELPESYYHDYIGVPKYKAIKQFEEGVDFSGGRVWNGELVRVGAQPHMGGLVISLNDGRQSMCGSSILSNTRSVTAAHCWRTRGPNGGTVQARQFTLVWATNRLMTGGTRMNTNQVNLHQNYNMVSLHNDIAVIRHNSVQFNNNINRINLPSGSSTYAGTWATVVGFGRTGDGAAGASSNPDKRQTNVLVITNDVCRRQLNPQMVIASTLCVSTTHGSSPCPGDSGSPLAIGTGNNRIQIGIVSFGTQWCTRGYPAAFVRVTSFVSWIRQRL